MPQVVIEWLSRSDGGATAGANAAETTEKQSTPPRTSGPRSYSSVTRYSRWRACAGGTSRKQDETTETRQRQGVKARAALRSTRRGLDGMGAGGSSPPGLDLLRVCSRYLGGAYGRGARRSLDANREANRTRAEMGNSSPLVVGTEQGRNRGITGEEQGGNRGRA